MGALKVSHRDFVVAWATAYNKDDVMRATGMTKAAVSGRALMLRGKGVKLPMLSNKQRLDTLEIAQLNSLIKKHNVDRNL